MLSHIYDLLNVVFGRHTVDSIVSDITKTTDRLKKLRERLIQREADVRDQARLLFKQADDHQYEAGRANIVAEKLRALVA